MEMSTAMPPNDLPGPEDLGAHPASRPSPLHWAQLAIAATRRRPWVFVLVLLGSLGAATSYYVLRAPVYVVETRILAQRQQALPSMIRTAGGDEAPTRTASEFVHQRENLIALLREADVTPPTASGQKGPLAPSAFGGPEDDPFNALVVRLDRALKVSTGDGVITISIYWNDPEQAYRLVEAALQRFLEARQVQDITAFDEAISLMQGRVAVLRQQVEKEEAREASAGAPEPVAPADPLDARPSTGRASPQAAAELARLRSLLEAKERAIRDMEDSRRRKLLELQAQLEERRGVYSEAHPTIISLRREIDVFGRESTQLVALREEEAKLREEYATRLAAEPRARSVGVPRPAAGSGRTGPGQESERLREARAQYQNMVNRVNEAQLALDTARAAFKHRYTVIRPAELPKAPFSPKPLNVFGIGGLLSVVIAVLAAASPDLLSGRILERWQVERRLDVPILGDLESRRR